MVKTLTSKFKVETVWPELVNKRVQQIDSHLKEIQFLNQDGSLLAKGSLKRQVKYVDSDGKLRKTEDRFQFEVIIGAALPEPLPFFTPELKSDYFIFQPRRLGENQALLEQGFILLINQFEVVKQEARPFSILTDLVVGKGKGETVYCFPVNLKRDSRPKKFNGIIGFEQSKPPVVTGTITGVITYRNSHYILKEQEVSQPFSFLIDSAPKDPEGILSVTGTIIAIDWVAPIGGQGWMIELKIDFHWQLIIRKELTVLGETEKVGQSESVIKADLLIKEQFLQFPKSFRVEGDEAGPFEVESTIKLLDWRRIGSGLLLSAASHFELFLPDASGLEKYRTLCFETEELVEGFFENIDDRLNLILDFKSDLGLEKITYAGTFFIIEAILSFTVKLYQPRVISLAQENALTEISGFTPITENSFTLLSEARFDLSHSPRKIIKVHNRLLQINPSSKKGWLNLGGVSEVVVVYLDRQNQYREESFRLIFQKSYCWEAITDEEQYQIDFESRLEYDSFKIEGNRLFYKYLWNFSAAAFKKRILKVAVSPVRKSVIATDVFLSEPQMTFEEFLIQGEIPLQFGNPREIASSRGLITEFNWRNVLNAVLVEGRINGEIEYWDEDGFLRHETVDFSFWRFLSQSKLTEKEAILVPKLRSFNYYPLRPWPWRKGTVRYEVDIEINNPNEGD